METRRNSSFLSIIANNNTLNRLIYENKQKSTISSQKCTS
jgi:hypothetical protein